MNDTVLSHGARSSVLELQKLAARASVLQRQIATGRKVIDPSDNPQAFFTSAGLKSRSSQLASLLDGMTTAESTISAATNGIAAIQTLVTSMQALANSALASTASSYVTVTGTRSSLTAATDIVSGAGTATQFRNGDVVTVSDGTTTATFTANSGAGLDTMQSFLDAVNNTAGLKVTANLNASGQLVLSATDTVNITVGATLAGVGTLTGILGITTGTTSFSANATRTSYASQYNTLRAQLDQLVSDASYNGVNLLSGASVTATFNEDGSSAYTVGGSAVSAASLGLAAVTGSFQKDSDINAALTALSDAAASLATMAGTYGAGAAIIEVRNEFTDSMIDLLDTGADALVAADVNEASASLLAVQTRQQIAATALAMTTNADNTALRLFGLE